MPGKTASALSSSEMVAMTNNLLSQLNHPLRVHHWTEINAAVFVTLYEGILAEQLTGIIPSPKSQEDEIQNCQIVIDTLSNKVLKDNLSHIKGRDIVAKKKRSVFNLLEVFSAMLEYLLSKIGSETSSENGTESNKDEDTMEDLDLVRPELIDDALDRELQGSKYTKKHLRGSTTSNKSLNKTLEAASKVSWDPALDDDTAGLIALGNDSRSTKLNYGDKTEDLIALGETHNSGRLSMPENNEVSKVPPRKSYSATNCQPDIIRLESSDKQKFYQDTNRQTASLADNRNLLISKESSSSSTRTEILEYPPLEEILRPRPDPDDARSQLLNQSKESRVTMEPLSDPSVRRVYTHHLYHHFDHDKPNEALSETSHNVFPSADTINGRQPEIRAELYGSDNSEVSKSREIWHRTTSNKNSEKTSEMPSLHSQQEVLLTSRVLEKPVHDIVKKYSHLEAALKETLNLSRDAIMTSPFLGITDANYQTNVPGLLHANVGDTAYRNRTIDDRQSESSVQLAPNEKRVTFQAAELSDHLAASTTNSSADTNEPASACNAMRYGPSGGSKKSTTSEKASGTTPSLNHNQPLKSSLRQTNAQTDPNDYLLASYNRGRLRSLSESDLTEYSHYDQCERLSSSSCEDVENLYGNRHISAMEKDQRGQRILHDELEKAVHYDDIIDNSAAGEMKSIQKKLQKENNKVSKGTKLIGQVYHDELVSYQAENDANLDELRACARQSEKMYKESLYRPVSSKQSFKKYEEPIVRRKKSHPYLKDRKRSRSASPSVYQQELCDDYLQDEELLPKLLEEFPYLHLSSETLHNLWRKNARQMEQLSRAGQEIKKNNRVKVQLQEAERKQKILLDMIHKDAEHNRKMKELKDRRDAQQMVKAQIREKRQQHVRAKHYYGDYQVQMRSKMLKRRTREELLFRKLFQDALDIQRNRIRELRSYAKEQRTKRSEQQKIELEAIENYYKDQFAMLKEKMMEEKKNLLIREKSQSKVLGEMKKELRKKMENEIELVQQQLCRDEDDVYFRELDAERQRQRLLLSRYDARI